MSSRYVVDLAMARLRERRRHRGLLRADRSMMRVYKKSGARFTANDIKRLKRIQRAIKSSRLKSAQMNVARNHGLVKPCGHPWQLMFNSNFAEVECGGCGRLVVYPEFMINFSSLDGVFTFKNVAMYLQRKDKGIRDYFKANA